MKCKQCENDFGSEDLDGFCAVCVLEKEVKETQELTEAYKNIIETLEHEPPKKSWYDQQFESYLSFWKNQEKKIAKLKRKKNEP